MSEKKGSALVVRPIQAAPGMLGLDRFDCATLGDCWEDKSINQGRRVSLIAVLRIAGCANPVKIGADAFARGEFDKAAAYWNPLCGLAPKSDLVFALKIGPTK